jgi:hypothetical protein
MRDAAHVPELEHNPPSDYVYRLGYAFPILDLLFAVHPGCGHIALAFWRYLRGFGNDEAGIGALRIIKRMQLCGHIAVSCSAARQRRHHDPVRQRQLPKLKRLEKIGMVVISMTFMA